jgi:hypothetical protein
MVFDYYIAGEGVVNMGQAGVNAATSTEAQLQTLYPNDTAAQLYNMEGLAVTGRVLSFRLSAQQPHYFWQRAWTACWARTCARSYA